MGIVGQSVVSYQLMEHRQVMQPGQGSEPFNTLVQGVGEVPAIPVCGAYLINYGRGHNGGHPGQGGTVIAA